MKNYVKIKNWNAWELTSDGGKSVAAAAEKIGLPIGDIYVARSRINKMLMAEVNRLQSQTEDSQ